MSDLNGATKNRNVGFKVAISILTLFLLIAIGGVYHFNKKSTIQTSKTVTCTAQGGLHGSKIFSGS